MIRSLLEAFFCLAAEDCELAEGKKTIQVIGKETDLHLSIAGRNLKTATAR